MEEPRCVTWFKVCLIVLGLSMLAAVLVIMSDVAYVWWQGSEAELVRERLAIDTVSIFKSDTIGNL